MKTKILNFKNLLVLFQFLIFIYICNLRIDNAYSIKEPRTFGDTHEYLTIASQPVFSLQFWTGSKAPVTSMFWKLVNSNPEHIFNLQLAISIFCWIVLAITVANLTQSSIAKLLIFSVILAFSLNEHIIMWEPFLGSESISISLTALFLACALWLTSEWKVYKALLLVLVIFLLAFTKEASAYYLAMMAIIVVPVFWFTEFRKRAIAISMITLIIFSGSTILANKGLRQYRILFTTTAFRIFPSEPYTEYFRAHGMPIYDDLVAQSKNVQPGKRYEVVHALLADPKFVQWASQDGLKEYVKFLWFFKKDTLQNVFLETPDESFSPNVYYLTATGYRPIIKDQRTSELLYPLKFSILYFFITNLIAAAVCNYAYTNKKLHWLIPLSIILLTYFQAVLVWSADALDIARHSIVFNVFFRLGIWILLAFMLDDFIVWLKRQNIFKPIINNQGE